MSNTSRLLLCLVLPFSHFCKGKYLDAMALFQRSLTIRKQVFGHDHLDVAQSLSKQGELEEAQVGIKYLGRGASARTGRWSVELAIDYMTLALR